MKHLAIGILLGASSLAAVAQTPAKPAAPAAAGAAHHTATAAAPAAGGVKLPPGVPPVKGIVKTAFALRYQDIKLGTGAVAEPNKLYKVHYTGWLGSDGHKFDSSFDHPGSPVLDKDGKPVLGTDGKPKMAEAQPMAFPQGMGRLIPGFDQGFDGMKVGGKRRLFIPWQLAYGARGRPGPDAAHPGIPAKADLIFDVELVEVTDLPMPPTHPQVQTRPPTPPPAPSAPADKPAAPAGTPATPSAAPAPSSAPATTQPATPATPSAPASPSTPPPSH